MSWSTRIGIAPKFGSVPIGVYQNRHFRVYKDLGTIIGIFDPPSNKWTGKAEVRVREGMIQFRKYDNRNNPPEKYSIWKDAVSLAKFKRFGKSAVQM